ncbi:MAG: MmgE/PrpD family protein [Candidatus Binatia bacterium]
MGYTEKIAKFVVGASLEDIPAKALEVAKKDIFDCVGVTLAGSKETSGRICARLAREEGANNEATVLGQGFKTSALMAAFANGTAAHALDYDHSFSLIGQPTAGLVPAIFPLAEALGANGRNLLEAYVVGFEVTAKLCRTIPAHSGKGGWHPTGTVGSLGAAVACAKLLRLDNRAVQMTLGIASSMASGIVWNYATMTKPLHAGLASRNGMLAARLAEYEFTANPLVLEGPKGFYDVYSRDLPYDLGPLDDLGTSFDLVERGINFKAYPCGGLIHPAIDAVLKMRAQHNITPEAVEAINVDVTQHTYDRIIYRFPETGLQGKFCMPYVLARVLIDGKIILDTFTDEAIRDPFVRKLAERVHMKVDPEMNKIMEGNRPCKVMIRLKDGRTFSLRIDFPKGSPEFPLTPQEFRAKFVECARRALNEKAVSRALELLDCLESLDHVGPLCQLLMGETE